MAQPFGKKWSVRTFDPHSREPFKVSRSKIDMFMSCPRCFYLEARLGVKRPSMPSFTLNNAVDTLLKKEFDIYRARQTAHPLLASYGVSAIPFAHPDLDVWRHNFTGVQCHDTETNLLVFGAVDDIWQAPDGVLHVVDYKATSKDAPVTRLDDTQWHDQYRRQMEVYQWLLRRNGHRVSDTGYFVYVNGKKDLQAFDAKLEFSVALIPYKGSDAWVDGVLRSIKECLVSPVAPVGKDSCEFCEYRTKAGKALQLNLSAQKKEPTATPPTTQKKKSSKASPDALPKLF